MADSTPLGPDCVAVVTGAGRGVGHRIATRLAAAGARVALVARSQEELEDACQSIRSTGGDAVALTGDMTRPEDAAAVIAAAERELGSMSLLVNSAGSGRVHGTFWDGDPERWCDDVERNLRMVVLPCHAALGVMVPRRQGRIITVGSRAGLPAGSTTLPRRAGGTSSYSVAKGAVQLFIEQVALECAPAGITVLGLAPGPVRTALTDAMALEAGVDPAAWLPWVDEGEAAAELALRMACGLLDHLTGRLIHVLDDLELASPLITAAQG